MSYSSDLFSPLLPALRDLPPQDRLGLQNDAFALVRLSSLSNLVTSHSSPCLLPFSFLSFSCSFLFLSPLFPSVPFTPCPSPPLLPLLALPLLSFPSFPSPPFLSLLSSPSFPLLSLPSRPVQVWVTQWTCSASLPPTHRRPTTLSGRTSSQISPHSNDSSPTPTFTTASSSLQGRYLVQRSPSLAGMPRTQIVSCTLP